MHIRIDSAENLAKALRTTDIAQRSAVLKALREKPEQGLGFGFWDGKDLIDELLDLCEKTRGSLDRLDYMTTVLCFSDVRVTAFAVKELLNTQDSRVAILAGNCLAALPEKEKYAVLQPILMDEKQTFKSRVAANLLARHTKILLPAEVIRTCTLTQGAVQPPALTSDTLDAWLSELTGPYPARTRQWFIKSGHNSLSYLLAMREQLPEQVLCWALSQGHITRAYGFDHVARTVLHHDSTTQVLLAALKSMQDIPHEPRDAERIDALCTHPDQQIRIAALRASSSHHPQGYWQSLFEQEQSPAVHQTIIERASLTPTATDKQWMISLLHNPNWRIRSAASSALARTGADVVDDLRAVLEQANDEARLAAANALSNLGKADMVEDVLG